MKKSQCSDSKTDVTRSDWAFSRTYDEQISESELTIV